MHPAPKPPTVEDLLPVKDFARLVGVKTETARRWVTLRKVESVKLGGCRIPRREIDRLIREGWRPRRNGNGAR